jgi:iron complex outermembrane receptor protein
MTTPSPANTNRAISTAIRAAIGLSLLAAAGAASAAEESNALEEVVVTAQFRQQSVQDTPLSITAVSAQMMEARSQTNITDLASQAPNVMLKQQGPTFGPTMAASIRGIGQGDFNPALEPGVGLYVDDVYYATLTGSVLDLLDLERVEILRGPQGTLAGRNSIGGSVKLYSQRPTSETSGSFTATYGSRNRLDLRGMFNVALAENLFLRISGVDRSQDGYIARVDYGCANPGNPYGITSLSASLRGCVIDHDSDVNFSAARVALRWLASDAVEVNWSADYTNDRRNPTGSVLVDYRTLAPGVLANIQAVQDGNPANDAQGTAFIVPPGSYFNYAGYYNSPGVYNGLIPVAGVYDTSLNGTTLNNWPLLESRQKASQFFEGWGTALNIDWDINDVLKLTSISAYRAYDSGFVNDNDLSPLQSSIGDGTLPFHSFSQELRLNGGFADNRWTYTIGGFYIDQSSTYQSWQDLRYTNNYPLQFQQNDVTNVDSLAFFGQLGWSITDRLDATVGVRYTDEHKDYTFVRLTRDGAVHPFLGALNNVTSQYDGNNVDYRVALQYDWTDQLMTYAQFATGFKGGGISPRPFVPAQATPFEPETLDNYELGVKSDFFDRRLRVNASVFYGQYSDIQLALNLCPTVPPAPCGTIANAGDAEIKGAEVEATLRVLDGLLVDASYSFMDFEYTKLGTGITTILPWMVPPNMPRGKWSLGAQYELELGSGGTLTPRLDLSHQDAVYTNGNNQITNWIGSYTLLNARLTWENRDRDWLVSLEGTNLTDEYYFVSRTDQYVGAGHTDGQPGRPREWAVTLTKKFF